MPFTYNEYKKPYLPVDFNPHCSKSAGLNTTFEQYGTMFENLRNSLSFYSIQDSMEIDGEKKILSPPTTPN